VLKNMRFKQKLLISFLAAGIIPALLLGIVTVRVAGNFMERIELEELSAISQNKKLRIEQHFHDRLVYVQTVADTDDIKNFVTALIDYHDRINVLADGPFDVSSAEYKQIVVSSSEFLMTFWKRSGFHNIFLICAAHGHVMATADREKDLGTNLQYGRYKDSGLAELWRKTVNTGKTTMVDFRPYAPSNNEPAAFIGIPVQDHSGKMVSVLACQLSLDPINSIMQEKNGLGNSGASFLVGPDKLMRSDLKLDSLHHSIKASFADPGLGRMETFATNEALAGKTGKGTTTDFRGTKVVSAYTPVDILGLQWGLVAQIDAREAFASVTRLIWIILSIAACSLLAVAVCSFWLTRLIYRPLAQTTTELRTASEELKTAAQQQFTSTTEQATATTEINTTFTEMTTSSKMILATAKEVVGAAETTNTASSNGKESLEHAVQGIEKIEGQVGKIVQNMLELGEKTKQMDLAVEMINELSGQTTILSYNATIEAEGAGQEGRRFSALAELIMKLANKAVESSKEIKSLIEGVQKSANTTLLATEEGMKAVEEGKKHAVDSNRHFDDILNASEDTLTSAKEIEMIISQQNTAIEETSVGVEDIHQASEEVKVSSEETLKTAELILDMSDKLSRL